MRVPDSHIDCQQQPSGILPRPFAGRGMDFSKAIAIPSGGLNDSGGSAKDTHAFPARQHDWALLT
ncbi:hypothetical protein [Rubidibacter lacunae]|uniref:hypothetical protein n=1 Tax=Rubidibacter lacunae TaxID=582514 RepID=UPI000410D4F7|nr:hypothetical protein [Rubidibacter lacunae]